MFQKRCFRIGILASILICGLLVGCGPSAEEQAATSVALTVTAETDWTIPADFDTYTDESSTFSISYPSDWEVDISVIPEIDIIYEEMIEGNYPELSLDLEGIIQVFYVGVPCGIDCYHPSCNIVIGPTGGIKSITDLDADSDGSFLDGYKEFSHEITIIDGRESIITEYKATIEVGERSMTIHSLIVDTYKGDTAWSVACGVVTEIADFADYGNDFHKIVRSFQLHY